MTNRENALAILNYENYEKVPVVHFGYWQETVDKWHSEGHVPADKVKNWDWVSAELGFDFGWDQSISVSARLDPSFEEKVLEVLDDGTQKVRNHNGVIELRHPDAGSIPSECGYILKDRESWENEFLPKLQFSEDRINREAIANVKNGVSISKDPRTTDMPIALHCGSLMGIIRDWMGVEAVSYLPFDDEELYDEIIATVADLAYRGTETILKSGVKFDYAHFWEDICFKNGPLVIPSVFDEKVGPYYKKITDLLHQYDINIISLDCDGWIDSLIPTWLDNGVNTMFPIEVGTWNAEIAPWREKYGKDLRGVGGMRKYVFAQDFKAIDAEIERLKPLVALGGYIPCPDHRIPPDAKWENVKYYCEQMKKQF